MHKLGDNSVRFRVLHFDEVESEERGKRIQTFLNIWSSKKTEKEEWRDRGDDWIRDNNQKSVKILMIERKSSTQECPLQMQTCSL